MICWDSWVRRALLSEGHGEWARASFPRKTSVGSNHVCERVYYMCASAPLQGVVSHLQRPPVLWPPDAKNWLIGKDPDAGKDWRQEEKGTTEDEVVGWHHRVYGHEFEHALGVGDGQGGLVCCSPWGRRESDTTERLNWECWAGGQVGGGFSTQGWILPSVFLAGLICTSSRVFHCSFLLLIKLHMMFCISIPIKSCWVWLLFVGCK